MTFYISFSIVGFYSSFGVRAPCQSGCQDTVCAPRFEVFVLWKVNSRVSRNFKFSFFFFCNLVSMYVINILYYYILTLFFHMCHML